MLHFEVGWIKFRIVLYLISEERYSLGHLPEVISAHGNFSLQFVVRMLESTAHPGDLGLLQFHNLIQRLLVALGCLLVLFHFLMSIADELLS
jgi:hypothetical protein